jgi:hypothetical protein
MKWITREKIKVDRVACQWLIKKLVDPDAEFVFLPHDTNWARISNGIVFDVLDCELGHHGEDVSFNSIIKKQSHRSGARFARRDCTRLIRIPPIRIRPEKVCVGLLAALALWD